MNGHLDTVPVSDKSSWQSPPFIPTLNADGSKLVGRGSSDMKSAVAVLLATLSNTVMKFMIVVFFGDRSLLKWVGVGFGSIFVATVIGMMAMRWS